MEDQKKRELVKELLACSKGKVERLRVLRELAEAICHETRLSIDLLDSMVKLSEGVEEEELQRLHAKIVVVRKLSYQVLGKLGEIAHD